MYTYDTGGNITKRTEYPYTTGTVGTATKTVNYTYDTTWKDQLKKYGSQSIIYDAIGNPLTYRDGMSFTWNGRQMKTANLNGTSVSYKYNADGLRTYKKVGSTVHEYEYSGGKLFYEKRGDIKFYYRYDAKGNLAAFSRVKADGSKYVVYAICNSRGDVEELRKENGDLFARYVYDSWGNVIHIYDANGAEITSSTNIAVQNPIRYRGYYFDAESGLYYLQSRYYDPVTGRFLNADSIVDSSDVLGFNMYAYCGNNPVARADTGGQFWDTVFDIAAVVFSAIQVCLEPTVVSNWLSLGADLVSLVVPFASGGGAAVRALSKADDIYDAAKTIDNIGDVADATVDVAKASDNFADVARKAPNPYGKKGGLAHQNEIARQVSINSQPGFTVNTEVKIETPGGFKPYRYADFSVKNDITGEVWYGNVGKQLKSSLPCARERYAISDIEGAGKTIRFFPYN